MPSKNITPFLVPTWDTNGWTHGWDIAKPFHTTNGTFFFMLKSSGYGADGNNVHIHRLDSSGQLGPQVFDKHWSEGWTCVDFYRAGTQSPVMFLKTSGYGSDGYNIHINEVIANGDIGSCIGVKKVDTGFTHARVYSVNKNKFLILLNSIDGKCEIYRIQSDGTIGDLVKPYNWSAGWTTLEFYTIDTTTFMFTMKSSNGEVHINKMASNGEVGDRVETYNWSEGWTNACAIKAADRHYMLLLKTSTGKVDINNIRPDGTMGNHVCQYGRKPDYTSAFGTGSLGSCGGPIPWGPGWTTIEFFQIKNKSFLFALKEQQIPFIQEERAKIYQVNPMESIGPMVMYANTTSATIWMGTVAENPTAIVKCRKEGIEKCTATMIFNGTETSYYRSGTAVLLGLEPNSSYSYRVISNGSLFGEGSFCTARLNQRGKFKVAIASCMNLGKDRNQSAWKELLNYSPDSLLQVGDNAYHNTTLRSMIWAEHLQQRGLDTYANAISQIPSLAIWDDHDFGPNNSAGADVEYDHREETHSAFRELFPGMPYAANQGIYHQAMWGDVEFFMLDVRYFRNHYKNGSPFGRSMLGQTQWNWLENAVKTSRARFKVIVSGTTISAKKTETVLGIPMKVYVTETWENNYPLEWIKLKSIAETNKGVMIVSGDIHECRVERHALNNGKKLYEIISSGMSLIDSEFAFALLTFDTSEIGKESLTCTLHKQDGSERSRLRVRLSEIS